MSPNTSSFRWPRTTYAWIRQLHLWIGAWGALAAILYGSTGLMQNHRAGDHAWPQGKTTSTDSVELHVPAEAQASPEALALWLQQTQKLDVASIRKGGPGGMAPRGEGRGENSANREGGMPMQAPPQKWTLGGGTAANSWTLSYAPGSDSAQLVHSHSSLMAALSRLHKGVGSGPFWAVLADSFAIGMILLGLSGIWMWARGRSAKEMIASVFGVAVLAFALVVGVQLFG